MPHDIEKYPYVVIGDGIISRSKIAKLIRIGRRITPIPVFFFAENMKQANELVENMVPFNEQIFIAKISKVIQGTGPEEAT